MNAETFAKYVQSPSLLYQLTYEELKTLALQYPYSQNLQLLLLEKGRQEGREYEKNLARAATYSFDRRLLLEQLTRLEAEAALELPLMPDGEVLQLRDLTDLQAELLPVEAATPGVGYEPVQTTWQDTSEHDDLDMDAEANWMADAQDLPGTHEEAPAAPYPPEVTEEVEAGHAAPPAPEQTPEPEEEDIEDTPAAPQLASDAAVVIIRPSAAPAPLPKSSFKSWHNRFAALPPPSPAPPPAPRTPPSRATRVREIAEDSVADHDDIASETLAELLVVQHQYSRAAKMYERLAMKYPEKSAYFASKIESLKK